MVAVYDDTGRADQTYGNSGPGAKLNVISFIGVISGLLLIINRLFWRWKKGTPGIDDVIIVFAWLALVGLGVVTFKAVDYGYGRNAASLTRAEASDALRMFYFYQIFYKLTLNLSKLSILTLYLRVFDTKDWFGHITKFLLLIVTTFTTSIILANILICRPIPTYWSTTKNGDVGSCINILAYWYASSLYNILSETLMLFSVLARIWTLPSHSHPPILQFRQKINLTVVLGLGVFTVITAILRMTTLNQTAMASDRTGGTLTSTIWSSVEAGLALAVANLPMVRQLLRWRGWCGGRWFRSSTGKSRSQSRSHGHAQRRTNSGYTPAPTDGGTATVEDGLNSRTRSRILSGAGNPTQPHAQTHMYTLPDCSAHEIHFQRDFEREVVTTDNDSDIDIDSTRSLQHIEFQSPPGLANDHSIHRPASCKSLRNTFLQSTSADRTIRGGSASPSNTNYTSTTPSVTSTLRSPTEPVPMVRISTEPRSRSSMSQNRSTCVSSKTTSSTSIGVATFMSAHSADGDLGRDG